MKLPIINLDKPFVMPRRGHINDVGLDLAVPSDGELKPGMNVIGLGYGIKVPVGYIASVYDRSSMATGSCTLDMVISSDDVLVKDIEPNGIPLMSMNPPIDPDYIGEIHLFIFNTSKYTIKYSKGDRLGQLIIHPITYADPMIIEKELKRTDGWSGSTGVNTEK